MKRVQPTLMQPQHNTIMRRVIQPRENMQNNVQINTVNRVSNTSVTSSQQQPQQRVVRQTIYASQLQSTFKCFICDENIISAPSVLKESETSTSREKVTKKLARLVGDDFCVIVSEDDVICRRCLTLFNTMDKYEYDLDNVRNRLRGFINKKYGIEEPEEPPVKIQRLSDQQTSSVNRWQNNIDDSPVRKTTTVPIASKETAESQLKNLTNVKRGPVKLYKCIACDFKTTDLNAFQPHSSVCKGQQTKTNQIAAPQRSVNRLSGSLQEQQKTTVFKTNVDNSTTQQVGRTTIVRSSPAPQLSCSQCEFKTTDRQLFNDHQRNHLKLRPFKCRMCLERFATREAAQTHARIHSGNMKCAICNRQFVKKEVFEAHMKTHEKFKSVSKQEVIVMNKNNENNTTMQKPLTDIIKEALSEEDQDAVNELIEFHSCNLCSLTFVNKKLYAQHMKTHESPSGKNNDEQQTVYIKGKSQDTMGDLERIFEKMHSETGHVTTSNGSINDSKNVLITTQESGGITYNITIPQDDIPQVEKKMRIDMPNLDDGGDDSQGKSEIEQVHAPVSMPSLNDEENTQSSQEQPPGDVQQIENEAIPMDLEELQQAAAADGQQLKFIVDENGQFLQLDNHILTTDAEGNQILVQGTDQEQLQHLLQSVGVDGNQVLVQLQGNGEGMDGEGATLQFGDGSQGQMILVQNENGESQLIDASMLQTEGGNLVLQGADGIPVSVSFSGEGGDGQITMTMAGAGEDGQPIFIQQPVELAEGQEHVPSEADPIQLEENSQTATTTETASEAEVEAAPSVPQLDAAEEKTASEVPETSESVTETTEKQNENPAPDVSEANEEAKDASEEK